MGEAVPWNPANLANYPPVKKGPSLREGKSPPPRELGDGLRISPLLRALYGVEISSQFLDVTHAWIYDLAPRDLLDRALGDTSPRGDVGPIAPGIDQPADNKVM